MDFQAGVSESRECRNVLRYFFFFVGGGMVGVAGVYIFNRLMLGIFTQFLSVSFVATHEGIKFAVLSPQRRHVHSL